MLYSHRIYLVFNRSKCFEASPFCFNSHYLVVSTTYQQGKFVGCHFRQSENNASYHA